MRQVRRLLSGPTRKKSDKVPGWAGWQPGISSLLRNSEREARMRRFKTVAGLSLLWVTTACADPHDDPTQRNLPIGSDGLMSRANLGAGEEWPLTVDRVRVQCEQSAVFLVNGSIQYPLNGTAKTFARANPAGRRSLEEIWRPNEKFMAEMKTANIPVDFVTRISIGPVLDRAVKWCGLR